MSLPIRISLVVLSIILGVAFLVPPEKNLRKGKDLAGGVTLVYSIDIPQGESAGDVLPRVIEVLKQRVDPNGQLEISFIAQGRDRIEVTMPLPTESVKRLRTDFESVVNDIAKSWMSEDDLDRVLRAPAAERDQLIAAAAGNDAGRAESLRKAAAAYDAAREARKAVDAAQAEVRALNIQLGNLRAKPASERSADEELLADAQVKAAEATLDEKAKVAAAAEIEAAGARTKAMEGGISPLELRRVLRLSDQTNKLVDDATGQSVIIPSPRSQAIDRLRKEHPGASAQIDRLLTAWNTYQAQRSTLDDPSDLKRMISGAGVLNFRITVPVGAIGDEAKLRENVRKSGPRAGRTDEAGWYKINKIEGWYNKVHEAQALVDNPAAFFRARGYVVEPYDGEYWMLCWDKRGFRLTEAEGEWTVAGANEGRDQLGRPAINFRMDPLGAQKLGALTEANVGQMMAVLLDDQVYTAPHLNSRISSSGQIEGTFSREELNYIIRVLAAGSLTAKVSPEPISESVIGPQLGADNLDKGFNAGVISLGVCFVVMVGYYFFCGLIAFIAMCLNLLLVLATMALNQSPLSVPGIAGIILTFAMSVDANVLIYERMREEIKHGKDIKTVVRLGYSKAMSAIVDGNMMHMIVSAVLCVVGTVEIRGFGIAMVIGVIMTLFTQLFVTRVMFDIILRTKWAWLLGLMLPLQVPRIERLLTTNIDWMSLRKYSYVISGVAILGSIGLAVFEGKAMLSNEFLGGTAVTLQLREAKPGDNSPPEAKGFMTLKRSEVEERLHKLADAPNASASLKELRNADVLVLNPLSDGFTSSQFKIRTVITDAKAVRAAIIEAFGDVVDSQPQLTFKNSDATDPRQIPAYPLVTASLGENIDRPDVHTNVSEFVGGVAFVLDGLSPPTSVRNLEQRIAQARNVAGNQDTVGRKSRVVILQGTPEQATSVVVLAYDPDVSFARDEARWTAEMKGPEWNLLHAALTQSTTLASVESFSPGIARSFAAHAITSIFLSSIIIIIYVWVRYAAIGYAAAALLATLHDVVCAIGLIALAEYLYDGSPRIASAFMLLPFKIDLTVVAALLTVLGSSINDKIICMDRIRENRGKLPHVSKELINTSLNQVFSRTIMTGWTVVLSLLVLYVYGGESVHAFAYVLGLGFLIGIYSSIAIGAPLIYAFEGGDAEGGTSSQTQPRSNIVPAGAPSAA